MSDALLETRDVVVRYHKRAGLFQHREPLQALAQVSIRVGFGECVGIVGESGCGKSTLARLTAGLLQQDQGTVILAGTALPADPRRRPAWTRRYLQMIAQDPYASLDPTFSVEAIIAEGLKIHRLGDARTRRDRVASALAEVGLGTEFLRRRPHELSGGQRQRVAIARALVVEPQIVVLDEPTSALDLSIQAQILNLLLDLQNRRSLSYLFISHDLDVIGHLAHRVYVMRAGAVVEAGATEEILNHPKDAYTRRLVEAVPQLGGPA